MNVKEKVFGQTAKSIGYKNSQIIAEREVCYCHEI